eukprot:2368973-Rhodomonas_salina.4
MAVRVPGTDAAAGARPARPRSRGAEVPWTPPRTLCSLVPSASNNAQTSPPRPLSRRSTPLYLPTRVLRHARYRGGIGLRACYDVSGTDLCVSCYQVLSVSYTLGRPAKYVPGMGLRVCYAVSGTELAYGTSNLPTRRLRGARY